VLILSLLAPALAGGHTLSADFVDRLPASAIACTYVVSSGQGDGPGWSAAFSNTRALSGDALQRIPAGRDWAQAATLLSGVNRLPDGRLMIADVEASVWMDGVPMVTPSFSLIKLDPVIGAPRLPTP